MKRPETKMPPDVKEALTSSGMMKTFQDRPPLQQNDYLAWIMRSDESEEREKRIAQMIDELRRGKVYMKSEQDTTGKSG